MTAIDVAALYVDPRGAYASIAGVDLWDVERDATRYAGPFPVVAHPPCGPWSALRAWCAQQESRLALRALDQVRQYGGVLEHPKTSALWRHCRLPFPGEMPDAYGGTVIEVEQVAWGHVARKATWIYSVGVPRTLIASTLRTGGVPTHWVSGRRTLGPNQQGSVAPAGVRFCSSALAKRTPRAFAVWLVELARAVALERLGGGS